MCYGPLHIREVFAKQALTFSILASGQEDIEDIRKLFKQARKEAGITAQKPLGKRENVSHNNGEKVAIYTVVVASKLLD